MLGRRILLSAVVLGVLAALPGNSPEAAGWLEKNFYLSGPRYDGVLPPCDYPAALGRIAGRFAEKEREFWNSDLQILSFDDIRETAFRPWAANTIPRRFCSAMVEVSDGRRRPIHYSIAEDGGMMSASFGVEWCVVNLDRNWAYSPSCTRALP